MPKNNETIYTVIREYNKKYTIEELIRRIIQSHIKQEQVTQSSSMTESFVGVYSNQEVIYYD